MGTTYFAVTKKLHPLLRKGDIQKCIALVSKKLASLPDSPFHQALELESYSGHFGGYADQFDKFYTTQSKRFKVGALYSELNAIEINPKCWHYSIFSYRKYGGLKSLDWLSRWEGESMATVVYGLHKLQRAYAGKAVREPRFADAAELAGLLVKLKFQNDIADAAQLMKKVCVPLLVSAHDSDLILELRPNH